MSDDTQAIRDLASAIERLAEARARRDALHDELTAANNQYESIRSEVIRLRKSLGMPPGSERRSWRGKRKPSEAGLMTLRGYSLRIGMSQSWAWMAILNRTLTPPAVTGEKMIDPEEADRQVLERIPDTIAAANIRRLSQTGAAVPEPGDEPQHHSVNPPVSVEEAASYLRRHGHAVTIDANGYVVGGTRMRPEAVLSMAKRLSNGATNRA